MEVRTRSEYYGSDRGVATATGASPTTFNRSNGVSTMEDVVGRPRGDNAMILTRERTVGGILDGQRSGSFVNFKWDSIPLKPVYSGTVVVPSESANAAAIRARNLTNPAREVVSVSQFVGELRETPQMIFGAFATGRYALNRLTDYQLRKDRSNIRFTGQPDKWLAGKIKIPDLKPNSWDLKQLAGSNLAVQFGWLPFLRDVIAMVKFIDAVERRSNEIDRLHSGAGLKRRVELENKVFTETKTMNIWSRNGITLSLPIKRVSSMSRWGTVRYRPSAATPKLGQLTDFQKRALYAGFHPQQAIKTIYELIPMTWLIDWFSNLGDIIALTNNALGVYPPDQCTMTHSKVELSASPASWSFANGGASFTRYSNITETKQRSVGISSYIPELQLPYLTGSQLSILASLTILKGRGMNLWNL